MRKIYLIGFLVCLTGTIIFGLLLLFTNHLDTTEYVIYHPNKSGKELKSFAIGFGEIKHQSKHKLIKIKSNFLKATTKDFLQNEGAIIEKNIKFKALSGPKIPIVPTYPQPQQPTKPDITTDWWANRIGLNKTTLKAKNTLVAILDTGCHNSPFMPQPFLCNSFVGDSGLDKFGHSTAVGSFIYSITNGPVAYGKVLSDEGYGDLYSIANGVYWVIQIKAKVLNLSLGSDDSSAILNESIKQALSAGVVVVAAAGNEGNSQVSFPARLDGVLAVSATNRYDMLASFSNYGAHQIWTSAPGENVLGLVPVGCVMCKNKNTYSEIISGTSFSSPIVAGVLAVTIENMKYPQFDYKYEEEKFGQGIINLWKSTQ